MKRPIHYCWEEEEKKSERREKSDDDIQYSVKTSIQWWWWLLTIRLTDIQRGSVLFNDHRYWYSDDIWWWWYNVVPISWNDIDDGLIYSFSWWPIMIFDQRLCDCCLTKCHYWYSKWKVMIWLILFDDIDIREREVVIFGIQWWLRGIYSWSGYSVVHCVIEVFYWWPFGSIQRDILFDIDVIDIQPERRRGSDIDYLF